MLRQIEFALFDMRLHSDFNPGGEKTVQQLLDEIRKQIAVVAPPAFNRFPNSFSHIFGGGYAAGYYSYKWAEVLSADAYSLFEESNDGELINAETGARFRNEILAAGGSRPALESFIAFRDASRKSMHCCVTWYGSDMKWHREMRDQASDSTSKVPLMSAMRSSVYILATIFVRR